jgi:hypothetical protein
LSRPTSRRAHRCSIRKGASALAADAWALVHTWGAGGESWRAWRSTYVDSDPALFAGWAERYCRELERLRAVDLAMVPDLLASIAQAVPEWRGQDVVLAGFIETSPQQQRLIDALTAAGMSIRTAPSVGASTAPLRFSAPTSRDELRAALVWARRQAEASPGASIGIAIEDLAQRRDEVRALAEDVLCPALQMPGQAGAARPYNLSLGTPLADTPIINAALATLTLAQAPLARPAAAALLRSPYFPDLGRHARRVNSRGSTKAARAFTGTTRSRASAAWKARWRHVGAARATARVARLRSRRDNGSVIGATFSTVAAGQATNPSPCPPLNSPRAMRGKNCSRNSRASARSIHD